MDRLPIKFETDVLSTHGIWWISEVKKPCMVKCIGYSSGQKYYVRKISDAGNIDFITVTDHEIAMIGLEAMKDIFKAVTEIYND